MIEDIYKYLYLIRRVEEEIAKIYPTDKIKSPVHLSIGQEAVAVGVCLALKPDDTIFGSYRSHAVYIAKGGSLKSMMAELYGKSTGCAKGKGGSMHLVDAEHRIMGTSAIVGTTIPNAVGYAFALKYRNEKAVTACFFGDGATDEGVFYESLNFASLKKLPLLFICENNQYAIHTHQKRRQAVPDICGKALSMGIPAVRIDNNDVIAIYDNTLDAAEKIRSGKSGPFFIECMTYRWKEHVGPNEDYNLGYRAQEEAKPWLETDQVTLMGSHLTPEKKILIENDVEKEIRKAIAYAEESPFTDAAELYTDMCG